jgi:Glycerol-3-phosphate acyltransferase C-terminal region
MVIHLFISEALVSASMYTRIKQGGGPANQRITYEALLEQVLFLSQLFRGEFVYATDGIHINLDNTLNGLEADGVVNLTRDPTKAASGKASTDIVYVELSDAERACGRENFDFYCFLIWPFIEASWLGAVALVGLTPPLAPIGPKEVDVWLEVKAAQDNAQVLGKTLFHQGDLSYFEAVNKETLKNAFTRFEEEGIISITSTPKSKIPPRLKLESAWTPQRDAKTGNIVPQGRLWDFIERIAQSRREGKNRRDGATVSTRVVRLSDELGRGLFEDAREKQRKEALEQSARANSVMMEAEPETLDMKRRGKSIDGKSRL